MVGGRHSVKLPRVAHLRGHIATIGRRTPARPARLRRLRQGPRESRARSRPLSSGEVPRQRTLRRLGRESRDDAVALPRFHRASADVSPGSVNRRAIVRAVERLDPAEVGAESAPNIADRRPSRSPSGGSVARSLRRRRPAPADDDRQHSAPARRFSSAVTIGAEIALAMTNEALLSQDDLFETSHGQETRAESAAEAKPAAKAKSLPRSPRRRQYRRPSPAAVWPRP